VAPSGIEAIKQCGSPWLPLIEPPDAFPEVLARQKRPPQPADAPRALERSAAVSAAARGREPALTNLSSPVPSEAAAGEPPALRLTDQFELPLIASLQPGSRHAREYFQAFQSEHGRRAQSVCVWVGPEGDFTPEEVAQIVAAGAQPISLGRLVLRVETAATYCLAILNHELQAP
jgi:16S rRNA U1498 N3-methylase RsmE